MTAFGIPVLVWIIGSALVLSSPRTVGVVAAAQAPPVDVQACYGCHPTMRDAHTGGHARLTCATCHDGLDRHVTSPEVKPVTRAEPNLCGGCHLEKYR